MSRGGSAAAARGLTSQAGGAMASRGGGAVAQGAGKGGGGEIAEAMQGLMEQSPASRPAGGGEQKPNEAANQKTEAQAKASEATGQMTGKILKTVAGLGLLYAGIIKAASTITWLVKAGYNLGKAFVEQAQQYERYHGTLANSFARLRRAQAISKVRRAQTTGGTAASMTDAWRNLQREIAPLREAMINLKNVAGLLVIQALRLGTLLMKLSLAYQTLILSIDKLTWLLGKKDAGPAPMMGHLDRIARVDGGKIKPPGADRGNGRGGA